MTGFGEIGQNDNFWTVFGPKRGNLDFSGGNCFGHFFKTQNRVSMRKNQKNPMTGFEEIGQNDNVWAEMAIFGPKWRN